MMINDNNFDLKTKAIVDGLVAEGSDLYNRLSNNWGPPKKHDAPVDDFDRNWKINQVAGRKLSERKEACLAIPDSAPPPQYRKSVAEFKRGLINLTLTDQLPSAIETSIDALLGNFGETDDSETPLVEYELKAAQAAVDDLFDGYLSRKDSENVGGRSSEIMMPPPLVHFAKGNSPFTQKTYFYDFPFDICLIGFPRYLAKGGVALWTALAHETGGHAMFNAYPDLSVKLRKAISKALVDELMSAFSERDIEEIVAYWMSRFEEAVSDCLGILNLGPAMAYSLLARGPLEKAFWLKDTDSHAHPSLLLRCHLAACTVGNLKYPGADDCKDSILRHIEKNLEGATPDQKQYWNLDMWMVRQEKQNEAAKLSAEIFSRILVKESMESLSRNPLGMIQNWYEADESTAADVAKMLIGPQGSFKVLWEGYCQGNGSKTYPAHVVAASVYALADQVLPSSMATRRNVFQNMVYALTKIKPGNDYLREFEMENPMSYAIPSAAQPFSGMAQSRKSPNNGSKSGARGARHVDTKAKA